VTLFSEHEYVQIPDIVHAERYLTWGDVAVLWAVRDRRNNMSFAHRDGFPATWMWLQVVDQDPVYIQQETVDSGVGYGCAMGMGMSVSHSYVLSRDLLQRLYLLFASDEPRRRVCPKNWQFLQLFAPLKKEWHEL